MRRSLMAWIVVAFTTAVVACDSSSDGDVPDRQDGGRVSGRDGGPGGANGGGGTSTGGSGGRRGGDAGAPGSAADGGGGTGGARTDAGTDVDASIDDGGSSMGGAGGDGGTSGADAGPNDAGADADAALPQPFALTSTALAAGGPFDVANTCNGANTSPPFAWTAGPPGTMSYAMVLTDTSSEPDLLQWVIYDIASSSSSLPADVQKVFLPSNVTGAKQTRSFNALFGYYGPCPPSASHTYQFALYALDVAALPGATMSTTAAQALAIIQAHDLAVAELTGTYAP